MTVNGLSPRFPIPGAFAAPGISAELTSLSLSHEPRSDSVPLPGYS